MPQPLNVIPFYRPTAADMAHEDRMKAVMRQISITTDQARLCALWARYRRLHEQRSPGMVDYLERRQGLR